MDVYNLVTNWKSKKSVNRIKFNDGVNFNTVDEDALDPEFIHANCGMICKKNSDPVKCFECGGNHFKSNCPLLTQ